MAMKSSPLHFCLALALLTPASCSSRPLPGPQPYPVHGKVLYQGQPAKGWRVDVLPVERTGEVEVCALGRHRR